jgi:hypothetical protein
MSGERITDVFCMLDKCIMLKDADEKERQDAGCLDNEKSTVTNKIKTATKRLVQLFK